MRQALVLGCVLLICICIAASAQPAFAQDCKGAQVWCSNQARCVPQTSFDCNNCGCGVCRSGDCGAPKPKKCDHKSACEDIAKMKELMKEYGNAGEQFANFGSFMRFNNAFSSLLSKLTNSDLACAFDPASKDTDPNPALAQALSNMNRDRNGFETLNSASIYPDKSDCFRDKNSKRCGDYNKTQDISKQISQLGSLLSCPDSGDSGGGESGGCPSTKSLEEANKQVEKAAKLTGWLQQRANSSNPELNKGFEQTKEHFEKISSLLNPIIKAGTACEKAEKLLKEMRDFLNAISEINSAGCHSQQLAHGFDDLFHSAGVLGQSTLPYPVFTPIFQILAQDEDFFTKVGGAAGRPSGSDQFAFADGYIPDCPQ